MKRLFLWVVMLGGAAACADAAAPPRPRSDASPKMGDEAVNDAEIADAGRFNATPPSDSGLGKLRFMPGLSYSGHDGVHTFKAPVAVYDADEDDLKVAPADPSTLDVEPVHLVKKGTTNDRGKYFMVTTKKPGTHRLIARSKGSSAEVTIEVAAYDPNDWSLGQQRYESPGRTGDPPCASCHANGEAIDHSPAALSSSVDTAVGMVITSGISIAGFPIMINDMPGHEWQVTDAERQALIVYLRGLAPRGFSNAP